MKKGLSAALSAVAGLAVGFIIGLKIIAPLIWS